MVHMRLPRDLTLNQLVVCSIHTRGTIRCSHFRRFQNFRVFLGVSTRVRFCLALGGKDDSAVQIMLQADGIGECNSMLNGEHLTVSEFSDCHVNAAVFVARSGWCSHAILSILAASGCQRSQAGRVVAGVQLRTAPPGASPYTLLIRSTVLSPISAAIWLSMALSRRRLVT